MWQRELETSAKAPSCAAPLTNKEHTPQKAALRNQTTRHRYPVQFVQTCGFSSLISRGILRTGLVCLDDSPSSSNNNMWAPRHSMVVLSYSGRIWVLSGTDLPDSATRLLGEVHIMELLILQRCPTHHPGTGIGHGCASMLLYPVSTWYACIWNVRVLMLVQHAWSVRVLMLQACYVWAGVGGY